MNAFAPVGRGRGLRERPSAVRWRRYSFRAAVQRLNGVRRPIRTAMRVWASSHRSVSEQIFGLQTAVGGAGTAYGPAPTAHGRYPLTDRCVSAILACVQASTASKQAVASDELVGGLAAFLH